MNGATITVTARPVLVLWLFRAAAGFVIAYPGARTLAALGATPFPEGDAALFAAGGFRLLEALRRGGAALAALAEAATLSMLVVAFIAIVPLALALASLSMPQARAGTVAARAFDGLGTLVFVGGAALLAQAMVAAVTVAVAYQLSSMAGSFDDERIPVLLAASVGGVGALAVAAIGVLLDLARADIVGHGTAASAAVRDAFRVARERPLAAVGSWAAPAVAAGAAVASAAWATGVIDVSRPGGWRVLAVLVVHQATLLAVAALRVTWLARALELVSQRAS